MLHIISEFALIFFKACIILGHVGMPLRKLESESMQTQQYYLTKEGDLIFSNITNAVFPRNYCSS